MLLWRTTTDITSHKQVCFLKWWSSRYYIYQENDHYASFNHNGKSSEYYVGILPISKHIGSHLKITKNNETQDNTSIKQITTYASLNHNGKNSEYYVGILPISKHIGSHFKITNYFHILQKYLENLEIPVSNTSVLWWTPQTSILEKREGWKDYFNTLLLVWIGCGNYKVALCFKHLLIKFKSAANVNATWLVLWKLFHYQPIALIFCPRIPKHLMVESSC